MPLWQKDFDFMQDGVKEALEAICQQLGLGRTNFIISGCAVTETSTTLAMASGWAWFGGEVLPVRAMEATAKLNNLSYVKLTRVTNYNQGGTRDVTTSGTSATQDAWQDDYLQPSPMSLADQVTIATWTGLAVKKGFWTLADRLMHYGETKDSGVVEVAAAPVAGYEELVATGAYYRQIGGTVQLWAAFSAEGSEGVQHRRCEISGLPEPAASFGVINGVFSVSIGTNGKAVVVEDVGEYTGLRRINITYLADPLLANNDSDGHYQELVNDQGSEGGGSGGGTDI